MKFSFTAPALATAITTTAHFLLHSLPVRADTQSAGYDTTYDNGGLSLNSVTCSDGSNGLAERYPTLANIPNFPNVAAAAAVDGWNSPFCGSCWSLTYANTSSGIGPITILVTAVDRTTDGFVLSQEALDTLTGGQAVALGRVPVDVSQVPASSCGLA